MFEQYVGVIRQELPSLKTEGSVYPPGPTASLLSNIVFALRLIFIGILLGGPDTLRWIGINNPPEWFTWMNENKVFNII